MKPIVAALSAALFASPAAAELGTYRLDASTTVFLTDEGVSLTGQPAWCLAEPWATDSDGITWGSAYPCDDPAAETFTITFYDLPDGNMLISLGEHMMMAKPERRATVIAPVPLEPSVVRIPPMTLDAFLERGVKP